MKDNTRNIIAVFGIAFMLFMTFGFIFKYCTAVRTLYLEDSEANIKQLNVYKTEANKITNEKCRNALNKIIEQYERTSFNGDVSILGLKKAFLEYDDGFTHTRLTGEFAFGFFESCSTKLENATEEDIKISSNIANSMYLIHNMEDGLFQSLGTSQFAIGSNLYVYDYNYLSLAPTIYNVHRDTYLDLIDNIIKYEKVRGEYNE